MATVIIKGGASPALVWSVDDGVSTGPTRGNGSNGGNVQQIQLHEGVNANVSAVGLQAFLAAYGKTLRAAGGDVQVRAF